MKLRLFKPHFSIQMSLSRSLIRNLMVNFNYQKKDEGRGNGMTESVKTKSVHLLVYGRVQAVGFRYFTWQKAGEQHITGWVRNRMDGSVEIVAEGAEINVDRFIKIIKKGARFSRVENVDVQSYRSVEHFTTFDIVG